MNLNNNLVSIFNRKNYKVVIIFLSALVLSMLFYGNYNLIEGFDLKTKAANLNKTMNGAKKASADSEAVAKHYKAANNSRKDLLKKNLGTMVEPFTEGMNVCGSNYSNLGVKGNAANIMVNSQCETLQTLKNKNKSVLAGEHKKK
tara:strand:- start:3516 stop:3950 length:435 start_codon:yes stop_codon:yes gene_type:complete